MLLVNFVDRAHVRMVQGGSGLRFALETCESLCIFSDLVRQELQGDKAVQGDVLSLIDKTHALTAELPNNAVVRYGLADHSWRILLWVKGQVNVSHGVCYISTGVVAGD